ncbi:SDR family NAD(P)-dependent oxidoreductase [Porphyrobacter sp. GA68]|uniref:SDR family NAD(P)-dependent oxidoreductase n=1 Tax=Porphyrobacter sp. GA68 TaxID=2883480 RepID=UPI001D190D93|nr:SDR family oxidoreductase [Porphyrobacter sp. GA68]
MTNILLTGASRGIGAAAMAMLLERGANVIGQSTAGHGERMLRADFAQEDAASELWGAALEALDGRIDVLINNAGVFAANPLVRTDEEWATGWADGLRVNLTSAAILSRLAVRHWRDRKAGGRLVHVASRAGHRGDSPDHWHYAAAKAGMLAMHKTIARAYGGDGIVSFAIAPGFVDTAMAGDYLASRGGDGILQDIPLGRVATPEEIARVIAFCALDAPASMTGATLDANGASYVR